MIKWLAEDDFDLALIYFHEPDSSGHAYGPDDEKMIPVIKRMDDVLGWLLQGLDNSTLKVRCVCLCLEIMQRQCFF